MNLLLFDDCAFSERLHTISSELVCQFERQQVQMPSSLLKQGFVLWRQHNMSRDELVQMVLESLLAGVDTSSVSIFYCLSYLSENPRCYARAQAEIDAFVAQSSSSLPKLTSKSLPFVQACLKEAMRLKPVGPIIMRQTHEDDVIGTTKVHSGDQIVLNLAKMNRDPSVDECHVFKPERFLKSSSGGEKSSISSQSLLNQNDLKFGFFPFGDGPKGCVGKHFAMREMQAIMMCLISKVVVGKNALLGPITNTSTMPTRWDIANQPQRKEDMHMFVMSRTTPRMIEPRPMNTTLKTLAMTKTSNLSVFLLGPPSTGMGSPASSSSPVQIITRAPSPFYFSLGKTFMLNQLKKSIGWASFHSEIARNLLKKLNRTGSDLMCDMSLFHSFQRDVVRQYNALHRQHNVDTSRISSSMLHVYDRSAIDALIYTSVYGSSDSIEDLMSMPEFQSCRSLYQNPHRCMFVLFPFVEQTLKSDGVRIMPRSAQASMEMADTFEDVLSRLNIPFVKLGTDLKTRGHTLLTQILQRLKTMNVNDER